MSGAVVSVSSYEAAWLAAVLFFRVLPFSVYGFLAEGIGTYTKAGIVAAELACAAFAVCISRHLFLDIVVFIAGVGYFLGVSLVLYQVAPFTARRGVARGLIFPALFMAYVVVPGFMFPFGRLSLLLLVAFGFELVLAAHSYCLALAKIRSAPSLRDCLFFLLVTPELTFPTRGGYRLPRILPGVGRVFVGVFLLCGASLLGPRAVGDKPVIILTNWRSGAVHGALAFGFLYGAHSGLAHLQIGLCRVLGYAAPERYRFPVLAASPGDFWERWNTYIGAWLRRYVYTQIARILNGRAGASFHHGLATVGAFVTLGAIHDAYWYFAARSIVGYGTLGFSVWGVQLLLWKRLDDVRRRETNFWRRAAFREVSRIAFLVTICFSAWIFL